MHPGRLFLRTTFIGNVSRVLLAADENAGNDPES